MSSVKMKTKDSVLCTGKNHCVKPFGLILMFLGLKFPWWPMILACYCKYPIMVGVINWRVIVIHLVWSMSWSIKNFYFGICQAFFVCHWSVDIPCFTNSLYSLSPLCENTIGKFRKGWEIFCWTESNSGKDFQQKGVFACAHHLPILQSILLNMSPWEYSWRTITDELLSWSFYFSARVWQTESHRYIAIQPDTRDWWAQVRIEFV